MYKMRTFLCVSVHNSYMWNMWIFLCFCFTYNNVPLLIIYKECEHPFKIVHSIVFGIYCLAGKVCWKLLFWINIILAQNMGIFLYLSSRIRKIRIDCLVGIVFWKISFLNKQHNNMKHWKTPVLLVILNEPKYILILNIEYCNTVEE